MFRENSRQCNESHIVSIPSMRQNLRPTSVRNIATGVLPKTYQAETHQQYARSNLAGELVKISNKDEAKAHQRLGDNFSASKSRTTDIYLKENSKMFRENSRQRNESNVVSIQTVRQNLRPTSAKFNKNTGTEAHPKTCQAETYHKYVPSNTAIELDEILNKSEAKAHRRPGVNFSPFPSKSRGTDTSEKKKITNAPRIIAGLLGVSTERKFIKTQIATVSEDDSSHLKSRTEQQSHKLNETSFNLYSPNSKLTKNFKSASTTNLSYISPYYNGDRLNAYSLDKSSNSNSNIKLFELNYKPTTTQAMAVKPYTPLHTISSQMSKPKITTNIRLNGTPLQLSSPNSPLTKNSNISPYRYPVITSTKAAYDLNKKNNVNINFRPSSANHNNRPYTPVKTIYKTSSLPQLNVETSNANSIPIASPRAVKKQNMPGCAFIFNNENFDNPCIANRVGSTKDTTQLQQTFEKYRMKVEIYTDYTVEKIKHTIDRISNIDYSSRACLIIALLSHGNRNDIICARNGTYSINDDVLFPILRNRTLDGKPKIFFVQACKGQNQPSHVLYTDSLGLISTANEVLKFYSTFEGYVAYRDVSGSVFISTLCKCLKRHGEDVDIIDIIKIVIIKVTEKTRGKQIPSITSSLTKPFKFGDYL